MSPLVIAWSMCAGMSLMLGFMHLLFWFKDRQVTAYLLSATMGFGAAASGIINQLRKMLLKEEIVREWFDLNAAATEIIDILHTGLVEKDVELSVNYAPDLPPVYAGRIEIQQVILNLLLNAVESLNAAPSQDRTIHIATRIVDGTVLFEVRDSGPGISSKLQDSLFDTFVSDKEKGLGVGLAICRRIIETYRGNIWADNAAAGGAVFSFTLPIKNETGM